MQATDSALSAGLADDAEVKQGMPLDFISKKGY